MTVYEVLKELLTTIVGIGIAITIFAWLYEKMRMK